MALPIQLLANLRVQVEKVDWIHINGRNRECTTVCSITTETYCSTMVLVVFDSNTVCVCVCVFSSHSFWTSSSLDVPAGVTQEGHTGFPIHLLSAVRALIFLARRIQPFLSLVDCEVEFCVLTI